MEFYGNVQEEMPPRMPKPRGKKVTVSAFVDANNAGNDLHTAPGSPTMFHGIQQESRHWHLMTCMHLPKQGAALFQSIVFFQALFHVGQHVCNNE
jgi:hypothetical protein